MNPDLDRPNGDLKPGACVLVMRWVGNAEMVQIDGRGGVVVQRHVSSAEQNPEVQTFANQALFGDLVCVLAVHYPCVLADVYSVKGPTDLLRSRVVLDARSFECEPASPEYINALLAAGRELVPREAPPATDVSGVGA